MNAVRLARPVHTPLLCTALAGKRIVLGIDILINIIGIYFGC